MNNKWIVVFEDTFNDDFFANYNFDKYNVLKTTIENYFNNSNPIDIENTIFILDYSTEYKNQINQVAKFLSEKKSIKKSYYLIGCRKDEEIDNDRKDSVFSYYKNDNAWNLKVLIELIFDKIQLDSRIVDYIVKSFTIIASNRIIETQKHEIEKLYTNLENLSKVDFLTGVLNRKALYEALDIERKRTLRDLWRIRKLSDNFYMEDSENNKESLFNHLGNFSCMMIDIDHFKNVNDTYGHLTGDKVLKKIGEILSKKNIFRDNDIIGRFGGEEFAVMLPATNIDGALIPAKRLREAIKQEIFQDDDNNTFSVTVSIGVSQFNINDTRSDTIIERADKALYKAKDTGRDKIVVYDESFGLK